MAPSWRKSSSRRAADTKAENLAAVTVNRFGYAEEI